MWRIRNRSGKIKCEAEYDSLWSEVDDVIENIEILSVQTTDIEESASETTDTAVVEAGRIPSSDLYAIAGNDQFSFECVKEWYAYRQGSTVVVQKTEESDVPYYSISPVTLEGTPGEEIVMTIDHFRDSYKERIAKEPEMLTYEVEGTDRKIHMRMRQLILNSCMQLRQWNASK